jgi:hypothetical protein
MIIILMSNAKTPEYSAKEEAFLKEATSEQLGLPVTGIKYTKKGVEVGSGLKVSYAAAKEMIGFQTLAEIQLAVQKISGGCPDIYKMPAETFEGVQEALRTGKPVPVYQKSPRAITSGELNSMSLNELNYIYEQLADANIGSMVIIPEVRVNGQRGDVTSELRPYDMDVVPFDIMHSSLEIAVAENLPMLHERMPLGCLPEELDIEEALEPEEYDEENRLGLIRPRED